VLSTSKPRHGNLVQAARTFFARDHSIPRARDPIAQVWSRDIVGSVHEMVSDASQKFQHQSGYGTSHSATERDDLCNGALVFVTHHNNTTQHKPTNWASCAVVARSSQESTDTICVSTFCRRYTIQTACGSLRATVGPKRVAVDRPSFFMVVRLLSRQIRQVLRGEPRG